MFRGKECSNRIELSQLVQDLLNFGVLGSLRLWGWGVVGGAPHTCAHACSCTHAHACIHIYMLNIISIANGSPHLGNPFEFPMMSYACMHVHVCRGHPLTTPHHHPSIPPPPGGTPRISQNSIALELIEIFQFCLKI